MTLTTLLILISLKVFAPAERCIYLAEPLPEQPFKNVIKAVTEVESSGNTFAYNPDEEAYGAFQIRQIRLNDYRNRTGKNITLNDCYDYEVSEMIFLFYATIHGPYQIEKIVRNWNGKWELTDDYWERVKIRL